MVTHNRCYVREAAKKSVFFSCPFFEALKKSGKFFVATKLPQKSVPILYNNLLENMGQDFMDISHYFFSE